MLFAIAAVSAARRSFFRSPTLQRADQVVQLVRRFVVFPALVDLLGFEIVLIVAAEIDRRVVDAHTEKRVLQLLRDIAVIDRHHNDGD